MLTRCSLLLVASLVLGSRLLSQGAPTSVPAAESKIDAVLQAELLAILDKDQADRMRISEVQAKHGFNSPEMQALWKEIMEKDAANQIRVKTILDTRGWLGPEVLGEKASGALFFVIQHADTATQQRYLPMLRAAVKEKKAKAGHLALMEDRVALAEGRYQTYGSQLFSPRNDGTYAVSPMEDPDHVDERRASVGLPSMAENLKHFGLKWDVEAFKKQMPKIVISHWGCVPRAGGFDLEVLTELNALSSETQKAYVHLGEMLQKSGSDSAEYKVAQKAVDERNAATLTRVKELLEKHGWIGASDVGQWASSTVYSALTTADIATKKYYLPIVRSAFEAKKAEPKALATLEDQVAMGEGRGQIYGTIFSRDEKTGLFKADKLEDPEHVDERRAAIGLVPLADYLKTIH